MKNKQIIDSWNKIEPGSAVKERMLNNIFYRVHSEKIKMREKSIQQLITKPKVWISASATAAFCLALILTLMLALSPGSKMVTYAISIVMPNGQSVLMEDRNGNYRADDLAREVSYVERVPSLRFFIDGEDIAKIELSAENEYVSAKDLTKTLDEKYWNSELYYEETEIDGVVYQYVPTKKLFNKSIVLNFPEGFEQYNENKGRYEVWYDWSPWNLYDWSREDLSRLQGNNGLSADEINDLLKTMTEEEKLEIAAGGGETSAVGHILLDGYPEELLNDRITITITDREGNTITKVITINISNNAIGQTVINAKMRSEND